MQDINKIKNDVDLISTEIDLVKLEDLNNETTLPKQLIDFINQEKFNGTQIYYQNEKEEEEEEEEKISCNTSSTSVNSSGNQNEKINSNTSSTSSIPDKTQSKLDTHQDEAYDKFDLDCPKYIQQEVNSKIKRTHLISLIYELYDLKYDLSIKDTSKINSKPEILIESYMEKLPPGKNLKNSLVLAWKKRYFRLNSIGVLYIYDLDDKTACPKEKPDEIYNLMGGKVEYEQNKTISLDDCRGNYLVFRCLPEQSNLFAKWRQEIDSQIVDRTDSLWIRPFQKLTQTSLNKSVLIVDIGTCSIRAGLFQNEPKLPQLFVPSVCSRDTSQNKLKVGFDAFDFLLGSSAPSTIDLRKSISNWSLNSSSLNSQLIFPFKSKISIDKLNVELDSVECILKFVIENLNINAEMYEIVLITSHKLTDKLNVQYLNLLLNEDKFGFKSACIINQTLMSLYSYNTSIGIIANLGEKIDITPICNGIPFQNGVTNLSYGGNCMNEFLNYYISRGHVNYVNDIEQFYVRYVKEKSVYTALNYQNELEKYPNDSKKFTLELTGGLNELKKIEFPESARFRAVEGLFNPEIWGLDGQGIHKLIHKAIQSSSMDLRREMARNIYLCGGMSQIKGLKERLEKELKLLLPPSLMVKVNCSEFSYHSAYLGAFNFIQQPEYQSLIIDQQEWINESVNCLRKWRNI